MHTKVQKWGNSHGIRLARDVMQDVGLRVGDEVEIVVRDGVVVVAPRRSARGRYRIEDLVAQMPPDDGTEEVDWGEPVGKEAW